MSDFVWDHVHLRSPDPDQAANFYMETFSARLDSRVESGSSLRIALEVGGGVIFIDRVPATTAKGLQPPFVGIEHIALRVENIEDVVERLQHKGVRFWQELHSPKPGLKTAFVAAPDGVIIELVQRRSSQPPNHDQRPSDAVVKALSGYSSS